MVKVYHSTSENHDFGVVWIRGESYANLLVFSDCRAILDGR